MKILLIITDFGSFNNFLSELAVQLIDQGNQVDVICSPQKVINFSDKFNYSQLQIGFHFVELPRSYNLFKQIKASKAINKIVSDIDPDIVNVHFTTGIFTTVLLRKLPYFTIGTFHGVGYTVVKNVFKKLLFKTVENFCFKRVDLIYVLNQTDYDVVIKSHPNKIHKYHTYGLGCDLGRFDPTRFSLDSKSGLRRELNISNDDFVLAYTGRFVCFKGFDVVIKAMLSLINEQQLKGIKLLLIGGEDDVHPTGLTDDEETAYKDRPEIIRVGFTKEVDKYLSVTDLFVFPSIKEGMPVCIMEALAMGVPTITSDTRGCNELVKNDFNGVILSKTPTVAETKEAIIKLYRDRALLKQYSNNAMSMRDLLDRRQFVNEQISIYKQALSDDPTLDEQVAKRVVNNNWH